MAEAPQPFSLAGPSLPAPPQGISPTPPPDKHCDPQSCTADTSPSVSSERTSNASHALRRHDDLWQLPSASPGTKQAGASLLTVSELYSDLDSDPGLSLVPTKPTALRPMPHPSLGYMGASENKTRIGSPTEGGVATSDKKLLQHLRSALQPADREHAEQQILRLLNDGCPGIPITAFVSVVTLCPGCDLLMASHLMAIHDCYYGLSGRARKRTRHKPRKSRCSPTPARMKGERGAKPSTSTSSDGEDQLCDEV
ncbi:hypothetical protein BC834DRAFT_974109 [Gloeopeniophorella convolvens]|nr:hypothetical protein BC834DRAFT_974109 [Gloeopeniophorella convolvens]